MLRHFLIKSIIVLFSISFITTAYGSVRYFGHAHENVGNQEQVHGYTNISVLSWERWTLAQLRQELQIIKNHGNKAVISTPNLYINANTIHPNAASIWNSFIYQLVNDGFFDAQNPEAGTVVAFYLSDEPELHGFVDVVPGTVPSTELTRLVNTVKSHPLSRLAPVAAAASVDYKDALAGFRLFDWVGINDHALMDDDYGSAEAKYASLHFAFKNDMQLKPNQRMFLVPRAFVWDERILPGLEKPNDPFLIESITSGNENYVIGIFPYVWDSHPGEWYALDSDATPELTYTRQAWEVVGKRIKYSGANAQFVGQNIPTTMMAGQSYYMSVTMRNTGNVVWEPGTVFLGTQNPQDNLTWGGGRLPLPRRIAPGALVSWEFYVNAPTVPGQYNFQTRMVAEEITWFGDLTPNVSVNVLPR